jgi:putative inorganic carbon (hco3(-)) transporter
MFFLYLFLIVIFVQPQEFWAPLHGARLVIVTLGAAGFTWLFRVMGKHRISYAQQNKLMVLLWMIITLSVIQVGWASFVLTTFINWGKFVLIYFMMSTLIDSPASLRRVMWVIVLSMAFTAWMGVQQYYGTDLTGVGIGRFGRIRGIGIFDTNQLAYTCGFLLPLIYAVFRLSRNPLGKLIALGSFVLFYYTIYLTGSRGGLLAGVFFFLLLFIVLTKSKTAKMTGIVLSWLLLTFLFTIAPRMQTVSTYKEDASAMGRLSVWGEALISLKSKPLGVGKDQFEDYFEIAPHSSYIEVISELGVFGLFVWLALFYYSIKNLQTIVREFASKDRQMTVMAQSLQISLLMYLVGSFFSGNGYYVTLIVLFGLTASLQRASRLEQFARPQRFAFKDLRAIALLEFALIAFIYILCRTSG